MLLLSLAPLVAGGLYALFARSRPLPRAERGGGSPHSWRFRPAGPYAVRAPVGAPAHLRSARARLYERVAQEPGDFALLELPLGWRNGARVAGKQDILIMQQLWYESLHGKRVLGGNTSRNPEYKFQYFSEQPTLSLLIALTNAADLPQHDALRAELARCRSPSRPGGGTALGRLYGHPLCHGPPRQAAGRDRSSGTDSCP